MSQRAWPWFASTGIAAVAALGLNALLAPFTPTRTHYVDSTCAENGNGTTRECGPNGPFRTIQQAADVAACGEQVLVRAGRYEELLTVRRACSLSAPLRIAGCAPPFCDVTEVPLLTGWERRADWAETTAGTWTRFMEAAALDTMPYQRDAFDPMNLAESGATTEPLFYAGDNIATPAVGMWSYHPATRRITVTPRRSIADVEVPMRPSVVVVERGASGIIFDGLAIKGGRVRLFVVGSPGGFTPDVQVGNSLVAFAPRMAFHLHSAPRARLTNVTIEDVARGISVPVADTAGFAVREFESDGIVLDRVFARRLGHYLGAPQTATRAGASVFDIKYTDGFEIINCTVEDWPAQPCMRIDASHNGRIADSTCRRGGRGVALGNVTPLPPVPRFQGVANISLVRLRLEATRVCGVQITDQPEPGAAVWARIVNLLITPTAGAPYCIPDDGRIIFANDEDPPTTTTSTVVTTTTVASSTTTVTYQCVRHWLCAMGTWFKWCRVPCPPNSVCGQPGVICG